MVGFDPYGKVKPTTFQHMYSGAVSGFMTRALCQPLDVLKIRFQLQIDPLKRGHGKYYGMLQATRLIIQEERLRGLWKGHVPAQALSVTFGIVQFYAFEMLTRFVGTHLPLKITTDHHALINFLCGGLAGTIALTTCLPLDVVRTRIVAQQASSPVYKSMRHAFVVMYKKEGVWSFYKGLVPTLLYSMPNTSFAFAFYAILTRMWNSMIRHGTKEQEFQTSGVESAVCGSLSGLGAKFIVYPLDVIKRRLEIRGFEEARKGFGTVHNYINMTHMIKLVWKSEGFKGYFKGLKPALVKAYATTGCTFFFYEQTLKLLRSNGST